MSKMSRIFSVVIVAVLAFGAFAVPTFAQTSRTITVTESQINSAYRVQNPRRAAVSNRSVDLQAGQVAIYATYTYRNGTYNVTTTLVPTLQNGAVTWTVTSASSDSGVSVPADLLTQINTSIQTSWRNYIRTQTSGTVESITISDSAITITGTFNRRG